MKCQECGAPIATTSRFCSGCGVPISGSDFFQEDSIGLRRRLIRELIIASLSDDEFDLLCFEKFSAVYENISSEMKRIVKAQMLVSYCERQGRVSTLLLAIKEINPYQYHKFVRETAQISIFPENPKPVNSSAKVKVDIVVDGVLENFNPDRRDATLQVLADLFGVPFGHIRVLSVVSGSIIIKVEINEDFSNALMESYQGNDERIKDIGIAKVEYSRSRFKSVRLLLIGLSVLVLLVLVVGVSLAIRYPKLMNDVGSVFIRVDPTAVEYYLLKYQVDLDVVVPSGSDPLDGFKEAYLASARRVYGDKVMVDTVEKLAYVSGPVKLGSDVDGDRYRATLLGAVIIPKN